MYSIAKIHYTTMTMNKEGAARFVKKNFKSAISLSLSCLVPKIILVKVGNKSAQNEDLIIFCMNFICSYC